MRNNTLGTQVASLIRTGDVHGARLWAGARNSWTPREARAIAAACEFARVRYGAPDTLNLSSFMGAP